MAHFINQELIKAIKSRYSLNVLTNAEDNIVMIYLCDPKTLYDFTRDLRNTMSEIHAETGYNVRTFNYNYLDDLYLYATAIVIFDEPEPQPNKDRVLSHGPMG